MGPGGSPGERWLILRVVPEPVASPTPKVGPAVEDAAPTPTAKAEKPQALATITGGGSGERHNLVHVAPFAAARATPIGETKAIAETLKTYRAGNLTAT